MQGAWYLFSREHDVIKRGQIYAEFVEQKVLHSIYPTIHLIVWYVGYCSLLARCELSHLLPSLFLLFRVFEFAYECFYPLSNLDAASRKKSPAQLVPERGSLGTRLLLKTAVHRSGKINF